MSSLLDPVLSLSEVPMPLSSSVPLSVSSVPLSVSSVPLSVSTVPLPVIDVIRGALSQEKYAVHLSVPEVAFMQSLLRDHPDVFRKIHATVDAIMADGKVDIFDVPQLIHLCSQMYHERVIGYVVHEVGVISLIRFTLDALLDSGLLPVHGATKDVIKKVVDTSLELLRTNVTEARVKSCWSHIYGWFQCDCAKSKCDCKA